MLNFMKMLNNISRSQAIYRRSKITAEDLHAAHYAFVLAICREPGRSQEELARELCINKSTVARALNTLETNGYILRTPLACDKRQLSVHPSEKMRSVLPAVRSASEEWMTLLSEDISEQEMEIFDAVLTKMQAKARDIVEAQEAAK